MGGWRLIRPRLSYANVVSTLCLFIVLGGGAYAATKFVGGDGRIHGCIGKKGVLKVVKPSAKCPDGTTAIAWSQKGPPGPSNGYSKSVVEPPCVPPGLPTCTQKVSLTGLPKGNYLISAKAQASGPDSGDYEDTEDCNLAAGTHTDVARATLFRDDETETETSQVPMALQVTHTFVGKGGSTLTCVSNVVAAVSHVKITAIKLGSVAGS